MSASRAGLLRKPYVVFPALWEAYEPPYKFLRVAGIAAPSPPPVFPRGSTRPRSAPFVPDISISLSTRGGHRALIS